MGQTAVVIYRRIITSQSQMYLLKRTAACNISNSLVGLEKTRTHEYIEQMNQTTNK